MPISEAPTIYIVLLDHIRFMNASNGEYQTVPHIVGVCYTQDEADTMVAKTNCHENEQWGDPFPMRIMAWK